MFIQGPYAGATWDDLQGRSAAFPAMAPAVAWAQRPDAAQAAGWIIRITDVGAGAGGSLWISDGARWRPAAPIALIDLALGGLVIPANTAETWIGPELALPGGVIGPGDRLHETALVDFGGSLVVQARTLRLRVAGQAGVGTGSPALSTIEVSSSSVASLEVNRRHLVTSATQTRSQGATAYAPGSGGSASVAVTIPSLDAPVWLRPSAQNASSNGTITIHHYGLTLEPKR